ncbi:WD40-repeat-containing domain protein [Dichotomocladium elegans]|nr:WD40-repeat-containing domain protein [Dichotomocladium elegans]
MEIHRCRFVEHQPAAINALDFTPPTVQRPRLAVGRANGDIEIWDPSYNFRLEKTIPGGEGQSVESIAWAHQSIVTDQIDGGIPEEIEAELKYLHDKPPRLFSSGLNPYIIEWDTTTLTVKRSVDSNGGAVWCLATNSSGTRLAAGCEDGCIRLFDIEDGRLEYMRSFTPQKGRVLSVAWGPYDDMIVSGGTDSALRTWDVRTGQTLQRMVVDRVQKENTLVWSVAVLKDGTLVSGDSLGHVMFWNSKMGTMKQTIRSHAADILALAVSKDGQQVFSAGVDCKLTAYRKTMENDKKSGRSMWSTVESRQYHSHDIRALALYENDTSSIVVSGGVDVQLVACPAKQFPKLGQLRLPPFPQKYLVSLSKSHKLVMGTYFNSLALWKLGAAEHMDIGDSKVGIPNMLQPHRQVLQLQLKAECNITSSALSENAEWIIVSDIENIRLFHLTESGSSGQIRPKKVRSFDAALGQYLSTHNFASGAHHVLFTPGSDKIIIVTVESRILIIDLRHWEENTFEVLGEFSHHRGFDSDGKAIENREAATVITVAVSADGQWLATGDDKNRIHVFNLDSLKHHIELPHSSNYHTVLSFNDFRPNELFVAQASNEFYIYNVENKRLTNWSKSNKDFTGTPLNTRREYIRGVTYNPANKNEMIVYASSYIYLIDMNHTATTPAPIKSHKRKHNNRTGNKQRVVNESQIPMKVSDRYQQILYCEFIDNDSLVMIERPRFSVLEKLPPSFYKSRFGA